MYRSADRGRHAHPVPGESSADERSLAVARRFVVLGGPELLGVQAEHRHEERQPERDERTGDRMKSSTRLEP